MLFGDEVVSYSASTRGRINQLAYHTSMLKGGHNIPHAQRAMELILELSAFYGEFAALIAPYVRMTQKLR
jgi:hypothetical protein